MLFDVYKCVQLNRCSVVCGGVLHRGQREEGWCVSSTFCILHLFQLVQCQITEYISVSTVYICWIDRYRVSSPFVVPW